LSPPETLDAGQVRPDMTKPMTAQLNEAVPAVRARLFLGPVHAEGRRSPVSSPAVRDVARVGWLVRGQGPLRPAGRGARLRLRWSSTIPGGRPGPARATVVQGLSGVLSVLKSAQGFHRPELVLGDRRAGGSW